MWIVKREEEKTEDSDDEGEREGRVEKEDGLIDSDRQEDRQESQLRKKWMPRRGASIASAVGGVGAVCDAS